MRSIIPSIREPEFVKVLRDYSKSITQDKQLRKVMDILTIAAVISAALVIIFVYNSYQKIKKEDSEPLDHRSYVAPIDNSAFTHGTPPENLTYGAGSTWPENGTLPVLDYDTLHDLYTPSESSLDHLNDGKLPQSSTIENTSESETEKDDTSLSEVAPVETVSPSVIDMAEYRSILADYENGLLEYEIPDK